MRKGFLAHARIQAWVREKELVQGHRRGHEVVRTVRAQDMEQVHQHVRKSEHVHERKDA